ncbi:MAG: phage virion morphogenesis protein [Dysgonamonadaceae bacterium]|jgi:phage gpG-like protein|nr:phage virion morphogenesis protein [Dysgonamonadaceae bacterium]
MTRINISNFTRKLEALRKTYKNLPTEIAAIAVNFSKDRFVEQAWEDETKEPWKPRKRPRRGKTGKITKNQTLLVKTGRLKRSIRKISATENKIIIGTDVAYAQIHNEGGTITGTASVKAHQVKEHARNRKGRKEKVKAHTVKAHTKKMNTRIPQRQFMGNSKALQNKIISHITAQFERALNT